MSRGSGFYRRRDGIERLWLSPADIEATCEEALRKTKLFPTEEKPAVDIESFVEELGARVDQYADLDAATLGKTEFFTNKPPKISINRDLTGAMDDDEGPRGIRGRWRATIAHEGGHVLFHSVLFEVNSAQNGLFDFGESKDQPLVHCLKKDVGFGRSSGDGREVQANMAMAALLMPRDIFRKVAYRVISELTLGVANLVAGSRAAAAVIEGISREFDVSKQAAGIRLQTLEIVSPSGQPRLAKLFS